jgi:hypothetical protein
MSEVKANRVAGWDDLKRPGDFCYTEQYGNPFGRITFYCPCGACDKFLACSIPIVKGSKQIDAWEWDGNEDAPTLTPSIFRHVDIAAHDDKPAHKCEWHGFLTNGVFRSC